MLERIGQVLLAEGQLASSPDLGILLRVSQHPPPTTLGKRYEKKTHRLQVLLNFTVQSPRLDRDDLWGRIGVVGNRRAALGAEQTVDVVAGRTFAGVLLDGTVRGQLSLGDNSHQSFYQLLLVHL